MKTYYVIHKNQRRGPFGHDQLVRALREGRIPADAELMDANTYDIVLESDLLDPRPVAAPVRKKVIDYGRQPTDENNNRLVHEVQQLRYDLAHAQESNNRVLKAIIAFLFCGPLGLLLLFSDSDKETNWGVVVGLFLFLVVVITIIALAM